MSVTAAVRRVTRRHPPRALILLYHRVAAPHADPFRLAVAPQRFEQHLELLRGRYRVISLDSLVDELDRAPSDEPAVVVTFDDGYVDNLEAAAPIAGSLGVPITVFVTVGSVLAETRFWWDELTDLVCRPGDREAVVVRVEGRQRRFRTDSADDRLRACVGLHRLLRRLPEASRRRVLDELAATSPSAEPQPTGGRPLTVDELLRLDRLESVTIGSHTVSHPALTSLEPAEREAEIGGSRLALEKLLGHDVALFSYPYGRGSDVNAETVRMAAAAGYRAGCTTVQEAVSRRSRPHTLPRLTVLDWTPEQFSRELGRLLSER